MNWLSLAPYLLALAIGAGGAWPLASGLARAPLQTELVDLRKEYTALREGNAETTRLASLAVAKRLEQAQAASVSASQRLAAALVKNDQLNLEKTHALKAATSGRACLSERAVRLLNGEQSTPAGAAASDSDVSLWIAGTQQRFEACRAQVDELIRWHGEQQPEDPKP